MKVRFQKHILEVIGNYNLKGEPGYVLYGSNGLFMNAAEKHCEKIITVADMVPGRKYKASSDRDTYLCIDKDNSMSVSFSLGHKYTINCRTGVINCWMNSSAELEEVP
jgi:hypothetical protein